MKLTREELRLNYNEACNAYLMAFCEKHGFDYADAARSWVGGDVGGTHAKASNRKKKMIHIDLFSGIGGFALAAHWAGWRTLVTCEIDNFCRRVLRYHFPEAYHHNDIHTLTYETIDVELSKRYGTLWRNEDIVLTGGFP